MDGLNVGKILAGLRNPEIYLKKIKQDNSMNLGEKSFNSAFSQQAKNPSFVQTQSLALNNQIQMNQLASMDRAVYIKNILGLPQTLGGILKLAQGNIPINGNTLLLEHLNQDMIKNQKVLSQIFDESIELTKDITLVANQQALTSQGAMQKDVVSLMFSGMIHLPMISEMILKNSKQAIAGLINAMASASKNGMTSEQIRDTLSVISSCVALAESGNSAQTLKSLMLLYLPWLPLNEGIGFDLEVETDNGENESNDSRLTVLIQTHNFGNVKGIFTLTTTNSVDIYIICSEDFPKKTLQKSLLDEGSTLSVNTNIDVDTVQPKSETKSDKREAKVNLSATNEMNPYLLLMAHAFIRNTIFIDTNGVIEDSAVEDS